MVKVPFKLSQIVPPSKWKSRSKNYQTILDTLSISTAETQTLVGQPRKYYFECKNAPYEEISLEKYKQIAKAKDREVSDLKNTEEKEKLVINILFSFGKTWPIFRTNFTVPTCQ